MMKRFNSLAIFFFFFHDTATPEIYTLSLHDALPILRLVVEVRVRHAERLEDPLLGILAEWLAGYSFDDLRERSEEHTSELQSQSNLVCRLLLEKKKIRRHVPLLANELPHLR